MIQNLTIARNNASFVPSKDSWCKFWTDPENYKQSYRLPSVFLEELKSTYEALSEDSLLKRCLMGLTQNQNEAINGILWSKCPKTKFVGRKRVELAVCETIGIFNTGAASKANNLESAGVVPGSNMLIGLRKEDEERIRNADKKVDIKNRCARRKRRAEKKIEAASR